MAVKQTNVILGSLYDIYSNTALDPPSVCTIEKWTWGRGLCLGNARGNCRSTSVDTLKSTCLLHHYTKISSYVVSPLLWGYYLTG